MSDNSAYGHAKEAIAAAQKGSPEAVAGIVQGSKFPFLTDIALRKIYGVVMRQWVKAEGRNLEREGSVNFILGNAMMEELIRRRGYDFRINLSESKELVKA